MKKYLPFFFLFLAWGAAEAFADPPRILCVAGFAAAGSCALFVPKQPLGVLLGAALLLAVGILNYDFALRCASALLLATARNAAVRKAVDKKNKNKNKGDGIYTVTVLCVLCAVGLLIADIVFFSHNPGMNVFKAFYSSVFFAVIACAALAGFSLIRRKRVGSLLTAVYVGAGVCAVASGVGFFLNSTLYSWCSAAFPWLLWIAAIPGEDPVGSAVHELFGEKLLAW